jgi:hypothetical protein
LKGCSTGIFFNILFSVLNKHNKLIIIRVDPLLSRLPVLCGCKKFLAILESSDLALIEISLSDFQVMMKVPRLCCFSLLLLYRLTSIIAANSPPVSDGTITVAGAHPSSSFWLHRTRAVEDDLFTLGDFILSGDDDNNSPSSALTYNNSSSSALFNRRATAVD